VFLEKLRSQGWLELFTNTQLGCSQPNLAEFYAKVTVTKGIVSSVVNGVQIEFDAQTLGEILGVPAAGFDLSVRENKSLLGKAGLLDLAQRLSQQPRLKHPQSVKNGDMEHTLSAPVLVHNHEHYSTVPGAKPGRCHGSVLH